MATVAEAVSVMDYSRLRLEDVCALLQYLPLPDEEVLLRKYVGGEGGGLSSSPTTCRAMSPWLKTLKSRSEIDSLKSLVNSLDIDTMIRNSS